MNPLWTILFHLINKIKGQRNHEPKPPSDWPLRRHLTRFAFGLVLPVMVLSAASYYALDRAERQRFQDSVVAEANQTASAVDREVAGILGALATLATRTDLDAGGTGQFYEQATRVAKLLGSNIILFEPASGRQIMNTRVPFSASLPGGADQTALLAAQTRVPQVSGIKIGQVAKTPVFGVYVPVLRDGAAVAVLAGNYEPTRLARVLEESVTKTQMIATAIDQTGKIVARSAQHERFVGLEVSNAVARSALAGQWVIAYAPNLEGEMSLMASTRSSTSGWSVYIHVPTQIIDALSFRRWLYFSGVSSFALLSSVALATIVGRYIARPMALIAEGARRLGEGEIPPIITSKLREANNISALLHQAALQRRQHEESIEMLLREVNHRSKNLLAVVQVIAMQTVRSSPEDFLATFSERVGALMVSQDLLIKSNWQGVDLGELTQSALHPFRDLLGTRIKTAGPAIRLSAAAAQTIAIAQHELATNAAKYGALSNSHGCVDVTWQLSDDDPENQRFVLTWVERDGQPVTPPTHRGFGTTMIVDVPRMELRADVKIDYASDGICWRMDAPAARVLEKDGVAS